MAIKGRILACYIAKLTVPMKIKSDFKVPFTEVFHNFNETISDEKISVIFFNLNFLSHGNRAGTRVIQLSDNST
jgi:hypothetical protein